MPRRYIRKPVPPVVRPAVERGIPKVVVDALIEIGALDEREITVDARLREDLHLDEIDIVELGQEIDRVSTLRIEDRCLNWIRVRDVLASIQKAQSRKAVA